MLLRVLIIEQHLMRPKYLNISVLQIPQLEHKTVRDNTGKLLFQLNEY